MWKNLPNILLTETSFMITECAHNASNSASLDPTHKMPVVPRLRNMGLNHTEWCPCRHQCSFSIRKDTVCDSPHVKNSKWYTYILHSPQQDITVPASRDRNQGTWRQGWKECSLFIGCPLLCTQITSYKIIKYMQIEGKIFLKTSKHRSDTANTCVTYLSYKETLSAMFKITT